MSSGNEIGMQEESRLDVAESIRKLPKVELHLHLEGAIPLTALWELIGKYGRKKEVGSVAALEERFRYRDFPHFIDTWMWKNEFLREYEDFELIAERVAEDLTRQNIRYAEAFFSPGDFNMLHDLEVGRITEAMRAGLAKKRDDVEVRLIADLTRDFGPERGARWLSELAELREEMDVIGIGIGGSEQDYPPEPYAEIYERARSFGFHTTAHAGEAAGADSIWGALRALRVERIGHGTRAIEDDELVAHLIEQRIPVEMCPLSNLRTGVVDSIATHPIREFFDAGMLVSVNTDDPKMFDTSLEREYLALMNELDFSFDELRQLARNAVMSSWCDETTRARLLRLVELSSSDAHE